MAVNAAKNVRGLGLCSGGLDSMLAGLLLRRQGIAVEWVTFETPFFSADKARKAARLTDIPLKVENITAEYVAMLKNPRCGYGQHMNPCMDCHALMFEIAGRTMARKGFDFLFSGEVVGQRPMSQTKPSLRYVEKHSGLEGYILRPLSAKLLPETIPEKDGRVDRDQLLDIAGRSRKRQMQLAAEFGIAEYPNPAGGCLLTDKGFSNRLRDLFDHRGEPTENELHLLRYGRHFRLADAVKLIVGRTKSDNERILAHHNPEADTVLRVKNYPGPTAVLPNTSNSSQLALAASICAGYSKAPPLTPTQVEVAGPAGVQTLIVLSLPPSDVKKFLI